MKTLHKSSETRKSTAKKSVHSLLVEHPSGHELLVKSNKKPNYSFFKDLIQIKAVKEKKGKSAALLISGISLCLSLLFVITVFEWKSYASESTVDLTSDSRTFDELVDVPLTEQIHKPPVQAQAPVIIEVNNDEIIEEIEINLDIEMTEDTRIEEQVFQNSTPEVLPEEDADEIFTIVQEQPSPVGGLNAFYKFVGDNLRYPVKATRMGIEGRVFVEFVVERDGSLTDIKVAKGIGGGCDEEALRVLSMAPKWNPGKQRGRPVRVRMVMPIVFRLL